MPEETSGTTIRASPDLQRSASSDGFSMQRTNSYEESRRAYSCFRAADLMAQLEMVDEEEKNEELNRRGDFNFYAIPPLSSALSGSGALLAQAEKRRREAQLEQQKKRIQAIATSSAGVRPSNLLTADAIEDREGSPNSRPLAEFTKPKKKTRAQQRIEIAQQTRVRLMAERAAKADKELPAEVGFDVVPVSKGIYVTSSTTPEKYPTAAAPPSPRSVVYSGQKYSSTDNTHVIC